MYERINVRVCRESMNRGRVRARPSAQRGSVESRAEIHQANFRVLFFAGVAIVVPKAVPSRRAVVAFRPSVGQIGARLDQLAGCLVENGGRRAKMVGDFKEDVKSVTSCWDLISAERSPPQADAPGEKDRDLGGRAEIVIDGSRRG